MSVFERLLKPDSIELPACRCGRELEIDRIELVPDSDARVRIYQCQSCGTELRLPESATTDAGKSNINTSTIRNDDRRAWAEVQRREMAEDRKIGQIILGSLAALALLGGLIIVFSSKGSNVADRGEPMNTGQHGNGSHQYATQVRRRSILAQHPLLKPRETLAHALIATRHLRVLRSGRDS